MKPQDPTVDRPVCGEDGNMDDPQVTPAVTEGGVRGRWRCQPGKTVTVVAAEGRLRAHCDCGWTSTMTAPCREITIDEAPTARRLRSPSR